ncbi:MAG: L,D-transpeptidase [Clostridia bacterium]|nr:L,D-transpeptidase [Clostridia bacterium]
MKKILASLLVVIMLLTNAVVYAESATELKVSLIMADESYIAQPNDATFNLYINGNQLIATSTISIKEDTKNIDLTFSVPNYKEGDVYYLSSDENISWIDVSGRKYESGSKIRLDTENGLEFKFEYMPLFKEPEGVKSEEVEVIVHRKGTVNGDIKVRVCVLDNKGRLEGGKWILVKAGNQTGSEKITVKPYYSGQKYYLSVTEGAKEVHFGDKIYTNFATFPVFTSHAPDENGELMIGNAFHIGVLPTEPSYEAITDEYAKESEKFINESGIGSKTEYFIWVSKAQFRVNVFQGEMGNWSLIRSFPCSIGAPDTPTITGIFEYFKYEDRWSYPTYYVGPIMRFAPRGYALHSVLMRYNGNYADARLEKKISHGCVRMMPEDIGWLADNMPLYTRVYVTNQ